ncbi:MAG: tetratricopeptide repeat protein, partial [Acidobacteriota bacterium]
APYAPFTGIPNTTNQADAAKMKAAEKALQDSPATNQSPEALHKLGKSYLTERNLPQAFSNLSEALKLSPNDPALHVDFAVAFMELGKTQEGMAKDEAFTASQKQMEEALRLKPNFPEALFNLALLHQVKKDWKEAEAAWRRYLAVDSNSKWSKEAAQHLEAVVKAQK